MVLVLDAALRARSWPLLVEALLDEPAHLLTAWLVLWGLCGRRLRDLWPWALAASVLIDVDHVPLYLWPDVVSSDGGRPITHCLLVALLAAAAGAASPRVRTPAWGVAVGLLLHLFRDLFSAPGVPLFWPVDASGVRLPYALYAAVLGVLVAVAWLRSRPSEVARTPG
jgi:inner membrane protein